MGQKKEETVTNIYFPFDIKKICDPRSKDKWTRGRLIDECYLCLDRVKYLNEEEDCLKRKYNEQANYLMYRIPVFDPTSQFIVNLKDLSVEVKEGLAALDDETLDKVVLDSAKVRSCPNA
jgi:hypothetical protein